MNRLVIGLVFVAIAFIGTMSIALGSNEISDLVAGVLTNIYITMFFLGCGLIVVFLTLVGAVAIVKNRAVIEQLKASDARATIERDYKKGDLVSVVHDCRTKLVEYPNDVVLHWYLALATYAQKDYESARSHFKKASEMDPRYESQAQPFLEKIELEWKPKVVK